MGGYLASMCGEGEAKPKETSDTETAKKEETVEKTVDEKPAAVQVTKPIVFVLGASGSIGSATCKSLSEKFGNKVEIRAGVRNPDGADKLKKMSGVKVVQASMADKDGLVATLAGVSVLYIVVPGSENRVELAGMSMEAATLAGVKHLAVVSVSTVDTETLFGNQFKEIETKIVSLDVPYTIIRVPYFMDNFLGFASTIKENGKIQLPLSGDKPLTVVTTRDAGLASAAVLTDSSNHEGKTYNIVSSRVTLDEIAATLGSILEKDIIYDKIEMDDMKQISLGFGMAEWQVDGLLEVFKLMEDDSPSVNVENLGDFKDITGLEPTSTKDFFTNFATVFK